MLMQLLLYALGHSSHDSSSCTWEQTSDDVYSFEVGTSLDHNLCQYVSENYRVYIKMRIWTRLVDRLQYLRHLLGAHTGMSEGPNNRRDSQYKEAASNNTNSTARAIRHDGSSKSRDDVAKLTFTGLGSPGVSGRHDQSFHGKLPAKQLDNWCTQKFTSNIEKVAASDQSAPCFTTPRTSSRNDPPRQPLPGDPLSSTSSMPHSVHQSSQMDEIGKTLPGETGSGISRSLQDDGKDNANPTDIGGVLHLGPDTRRNLYVDYTTDRQDPVVHDNIFPHVHTIYQPRRVRSIHLHEHKFYIQPIIQPTGDNGPGVQVK